MKKSVLYSIFAFFGILFFMGCSTQNNQVKNELWHDVRSIDNLIGKWEGYKDVDIPQNKENYLPKSSIEIGISLEYIEGSQEVIANMRFDLNRLLTDWITIEEIRLAGLTKDDLWEFLVNEFEAMEIFIVGGKYFVNFNLSDSADVFLSNDSNGKLMINEKANKIKFLFFEKVSFGLGDSGFDEIILQKR